MALTEAQKRVLKGAKLALQAKSWYRGVCLDHFPSDEECKNNYNHAVDMVVMETELWDKPKEANQ